MCTVTFVPLPNHEKSFVLTSNRDEAVIRKTLPPEIYVEKGMKLLYPRDVEAGGTWIGISEKQRTICLLNGAFKKHVRTPPYRKSRGVVVKDLLTASHIKETIAAYNFEGIEPFTALILDFPEELEFTELVWAGNQYHLRELPLKPDIWASALLYSEEEIVLRKKKFETFQAKHSLNPEDMLKFHSYGGSSSEEGLIIDRGFLKTCSITQVSHFNGPVKMWYNDLSTGIVSEKELQI